MVLPMNRGMSAFQSWCFPQAGPDARIAATVLPAGRIHYRHVDTADGGRTPLAGIPEAGRGLDRESPRALTR